MRIIKTIALCAAVLAGTAGPASAEPAKETIVILHGIGHSRLNMAITEMALKEQGYDTLNISYPSLKHDIATLSGFVHDRLDLAGVWNKSAKVHFVTHSMGGLVTRTYLEKYKEDIPHDKLGRVVMLAPPNGGSEVADLLKNFPPYQWVFGPAGQELTTENQTKNGIRPYYDLGIIAGTKEWPYIVAAFVIPGQSDGRVALEKTKLEGMKDHLTLPATHSFISWKPDVHKQIVYFLRNGEFEHAE